MARSGDYRAQLDPVLLPRTREHGASSARASRPIRHRVYRPALLPAGLLLQYWLGPELPNRSNRGRPGSAISGTPAQSAESATHTAPHPLHLSPTGVICRRRCQRAFHDPQCSAGRRICVCGGKRPQRLSHHADTAWLWRARGLGRRPARAASAYARSCDTDGRKLRGLPLMIC